MLLFSLFLAQTAPTGLSSWVENFFYVIGGLAAGIAAYALLRPTQIEQPLKIEQTELHLMNVELKSQTQTLNKLDREVGQVRTVVDIVKQQVDGLHQRTGSISRDLAATAARVEGLEKISSNTDEIAKQVAATAAKVEGLEKREGRRDA
jgi:septal ring factor EnvC (AmiA/AmiB activator)